MMMNEERREEALEMSESGAAGSYDNPDDFRTLGLQLLCRDDGVPDTSATEGASSITIADIGRIIRLRRERSALSRRALATMSDISPRTIAAVEQGRSHVRIGSILTLLSVLGIGLRFAE